MPASDPDLTQLNLVGRSPVFLAAVNLLKRLATCEISVLLRGETGTGKELAARAIHYLSARRNLPFIPVNCGAIPELLVESELFGHVRGAFTDAHDSQLGLVAQADNGTLFLDEVDSLSMRAQISLLRFLQDGSFRPLGGKSFARSAARIVAATNADIEALVQRGTFRKDLFFRLSVVPVVLPPLRDRAGDVRLLAESFLRTLAEQQGVGPRRIDEVSLCQLERYSWPGNVRELANVIQRIFILAEGNNLTLPPGFVGPLEGRAEEFVGSTVGSFRRARSQALAEFECRFVRNALTQSAGNVSLAARRASKERRSFGRLLKKHGIDRAEFTRAP
jgi:DNA-binding NtrC family response regulator